MLSRIILPSEQLASFVHHYWVMRFDGHPMEMSIMPTGCMKWMFHRGTPFAVNGIVDSSNVASVCGQYHSAANVSTFEHTDLIFVFFHPYALKTIMGMPCSMFAGANVDMDDLGIPEFKLLKNMVLDADTDDRAIAIIEDFITQRLARSNDLLTIKRMMSVCEEIDHHPNSSVDMLADKACLGERQFRRFFEENVGISPKLMIRTKRCLQACRTIQSLQITDFKDIVNRLGFTDHSHLNKEFKAFAGMSPSQYQQHIRHIQQENFLRGYRAYHK